jgi:hypothetical protein
VLLDELILLSTERTALEFGTQRWCWYASYLGYARFTSRFEGLEGLVMRTAHFIIWSALAFPFAAACGSTSDNDSNNDSGITAPPPDYSTGIDRDAPVSSISPSEAEDVCLGIQEFAEDSFNYGVSNATLCTVQAYETVGMLIAADPPTEAEMQAACAEARDECIVDPPSNLRGDFQADPTECRDAMFPDCEAEVADFEDCYNWQIDHVVDGINDLPTCDELTYNALQGLLPQLMAIFDPADVPAACERLEACGDLGANSGGSASSGAAGGSAQ